MTKKSTQILSIFILIFSVTFAAQEFDEEYLASLPENIRNDLEQKIKEKEETEKPVYRRASSMTDKELEERKKLNRFGDLIFDMMQTSFMPTNEPNFDGTYILDFGDVLEIQLVGQNNETIEQAIKRDGSINLSNIGKIYVSGISLSQAVDLIQNKIKDAYIGTNAYISVTNIRDIQILVSGNSYNPGIYTLNGNSNMLHVLAMAGGIDKNGSYREIKHIRNNEVIDTLDLYDIFIYGKSFVGKRLRSGDSVFVSPVKNLSSIMTGVKRPGVYEVKRDETFQDLINFANGFSKKAIKDVFYIERIIESEVKVLELDQKNLISKIIEGDTLFIKELNLGSVEITGAVNRPGTYTITEGEKLLSLIQRAGGYNKSAYPLGGVLINQNTLQVNKEAQARLYNKYLETLLINANETFDQSFLILLDEFKNAEASGRVIAEFDLDYLEQNPDQNTTLYDKDEIFIPKITEQVYVYGEVQNPGTVRFSSNKDINYYIKNSGGLGPLSSKKNIYIVQPNGESFLVKSGRLSFLDRGSNSIFPGSIIYVPRKTNIDSLQVASIWAPIISSLALSLTSLSVLDNQ